MEPPRIVIPGGRPKHQKQLQMAHPLASVNCGPVTELVGLEAASGNELRPIGANRGLWINAIRRPMRRGTSWPSTTLQNIEESVESNYITKRMRERGLGNATARMRKITHGEAITLLKQGKFLHVAIMYDRLNRLMPNLSGDPNFGGPHSGHAIGLYGHTFARGWAWTYLYDPLHDGRRAGIPKGVQTVRIRRYLRAAETWGNAGAGNAWVVVIR